MGFSSFLHYRLRPLRLNTACSTHFVFNYPLSRVYWTGSHSFSFAGFNALLEGSKGMRQMFECEDGRQALGLKGCARGRSQVELR